MTIPFDDFGGAGPLIHFAHANGYPPGSYRQFLSQLTSAGHVVAMHQRPLWPNSLPEELTSWDVFGDDLLRFLDEQGAEQVVGMGHSMGAVATLWAALKEPSRFSALVLIEPVFLPPRVLQLIIDNPDAWQSMPLVLAAQRRRNRWESRAAAFARFREKPVFARWSDDVLNHYLDAGLHEAEGAVNLRFSREWESSIYAKPPMTVWEELSRPSPPILAIRGAESDTIHPTAWQLWQEIQPATTFVEIPDCGHLVTMEQPDLLAKTILSYLARGE